MADKPEALAIEREFIRPQPAVADGDLMRVLRAASPDVGCAAFAHRLGEDLLPIVEHAVERRLDELGLGLLLRGLCHAMPPHF